MPYVGYFLLYVGYLGNAHGILYGYLVIWLSYGTISYGITILMGWQ